MATRRRRSSTTAEVLKDNAKKLGNTLTILWDDLASWQRDNHYIHSGYRPASYSFGKSYASLLYLHNESVNIYSHLLGAVSIGCVGASIYQAVGSRYESANAGDIFTIGCFFVSAVLCMGMSATYHTILNHSQHVARYGNKLDYLGIVFLTTGSFIPCLYYGFNCHPHLRDVYCTLVRSNPFLNLPS